MYEFVIVLSVIQTLIGRARYPKEIRRSRPSAQLRSSTSKSYYAGDVSDGVAVERQQLLSTR